VPIELMEEPANYIGEPEGVEWSKNGTNWVFRIATSSRAKGEAKSLQEWLNDQFAQIFQQKYGGNFELLARIACMLGSDVSRKLNEGIQRLKVSLLSSS
jgi:hypothetical protein